MTTTTANSPPTIEFAATYSADKSGIKDIFRTEPLSNGIELVTENEAPSWAASVRTIFEDASVRLAQGPPGPSGRDLYDSFASSISSHFSVFSEAHTFVMVFDDKRYVPERKRVAQVQRRIALAESIARRGVPEWTWDGQSTIVSITDERPLPPWERVRANGAAYARVIDELGALLERRFSPPPGRRVIVDTGFRVSVIETALDGTVLMPRTLLDNEKPPIGEGDMTALYYARRARSPTYDRSDARPSDAEAYARSDSFDPTIMCYYADDTSETPPSMRLLPLSMRPQHAVAAENVRTVYEAGAVLLRTVDTDFLSLALVCLAGADSTSAAHNIYVGLGRVHRKNNQYCTGTTPDAIPHQEYYDVQRIYDELCAMHASEPRSIVTAWSFAAFCIACGNDYTRRLHNLSHRTMYAGYKRAFLGSDESRRRRLVTKFATSDTTPAVALLDVDAFVELIRHAYYERLSKSRRPLVTPPWSELRSIVAEAKNERAHMPNLDALTAYYDQVSWSLAYASGASYGAEHLPP